MKRRGWERREFIGVVAAYLWCAVGGRANPEQLDTTSAELREARLLVATLTNRRSAVQVGRRYLAKRGTDLETLVVSLAPELEGARDLDGVRRRLATRQRKDFARGRLESLDGWLLPESELQLYALAALLRERA